MNSVNCAVNRRQGGSLTDVFSNYRVKSHWYSIDGSRVHKNGQLE